SDGVLLGKYFLENRTPVEFEQISPNVINALVAIEDARFTKHSGVDPRGLLRAVNGVFTGQSGSSGGGSTLTQQLVKNLFEARTEKYKGVLGNVPLLKMLIIKAKEWITSIKIERSYTKQEIMTMYLNTVEFGSNAYGIRSASRTYFAKEPSQLSVSEAAVLMGMVQNPTRLNPKFHPKAAFDRRNTVFAQMVKYGYLDQGQAARLKAQPIRLDYHVENHTNSKAPYFMAVMKDQLVQQLNELNQGRPDDDQLDLYTSGLKIFVTLDSRMQAHATEAISTHMRDQQAKFNAHWGKLAPWRDENGKEIRGFIEKSARRTDRYRELKAIYGTDEKAIFREMNKPNRMRVFSWRNEEGVDTTMTSMDSIRYYKRFLNTGFMSMDPNNGHVKAWVGGINFKYFKYDHVRQSRRQPGSSFKPFIYATAIDNGFTPCDHVTDQPIHFGPEDGVPGGWTPKNSNGRYSGQSFTLRKAIGQSVNTVSAYLIKKFGPREVVRYANQIGITSPLVANPALCLGASDVSVYEMVNAYSTFVNEGKRWKEPLVITRIDDRYGNVLKTLDPEFRDALSPETAYLMVHMLKGALQEQGGTAQRLNTYECGKNNEIGAKTGTTSNHSDGWFMGITQNLVSGLWVGGDDRSIHFRSLALGAGGKMAMPAWAMYMDKVYADKTLGIEKIPFKKPTGTTISLDCSGYGSGSDSIQVIQPTVKPKGQDGLL
ncbi:MAG: transglycosylase domain-containing protein, partial [Sphingobacteriaceae bacterium]|nr:transglycosylase domain-containing protein [Cytophagaceae bacterium]